MKKLFLMLEKLQRAHHTLSGHFTPASLGGSNKLRAYLFFIYAHVTPKKDKKRGVLLCSCNWHKPPKNILIRLPNRSFNKRVKMISMYLWEQSFSRICFPRIIKTEMQEYLKIRIVYSFFEVTRFYFYCQMLDSMLDSKPPF